MKYYQRNIELLQKTSAMSKDEITKMSNAQSQKNGLNNKYDSYSI
jgi:hypothetical protein